MVSSTIRSYFCVLLLSHKNGSQENHFLLNEFGMKCHLQFYPLNRQFLAFPISPSALRNRGIISLKHRKGSGGLGP